MEKPTINVNAPVESAKEAAKTQAHQIASAVQSGLPPSNRQIEGVIDTTQQFLEQKQSTLPPAAAKAVGDISQVLEDTKQFMFEKNADEAVQKTFIHAKAASEALGGAAASEVLPKGQEWGAEISDKAKDIFNSSTTLVRQLVSSGEFRKLLIDLVDVTESLFWRVRSTTEEQTDQAPSLTKALKQDIAQEKNPLSQGLPRTQAAAKEIGNRLQYALRDESSFTPEERQLIRERFRDVLLRLKKNPQFQKSINNISSLFSYMRSEFVESLNKAADNSVSKYNYSMMTKEAQKFLERFADRNAIEGFYTAVNGFITDISNDSEIDSLMQEMRALFDEGLDNPERLVNDQGYIDRAENTLRRLRLKFQQMGDHPYLSDISRNAKAILNSIMEDPLRMKLAADTQIMVQNFFSRDLTGNLQLNTELLGEMRRLLVPLITEQMKWVPLPRIEGSNETYDYWFDDVVFSAPDLVPDQVHIRMASEGDFDVKNLQTDNFKTFIRVSAEGIKTTLKDIQFWFRRKSFPRTEDTGYATLDITGDGIKLDLIISVSQGENPFQVRRVNVSIDGMKLHVADTRHDWLYNTITTLFGGVIKTRIEHEIQSGLQYGADIINTQLNRIVYKTFQEVSSAAQTSVLQQATY